VKVAVFSASASPHMRVYLKALVDAGHEVTLITSNGHGGNDDIDYVPVVRTMPVGPIESRLPRRIRILITGRRLRRALRRGRFDVLNVQQLTSVGVLAASLFHGPTVLTFWGSDLLRPEISPVWARKRLPPAVRAATIVHVCSDQMKEAVLALGASPERVACFQYGIDLDLFRFGGAPRHGHTIVSTRQLKPLYRVGTIVRAFALVRDRVADATLVVFGADGEHDDLVALAAELGVADAVDFVGYAPTADLVAAVATAAVWVSLPPSDGTPLSLLEVMAAGAVPVVADIPTLHDWIAPGHGVFVSEVTPEKVAEGIVEGFRMAATAEYAAANRAVVEARGDRAKNLPRFVRIVEAAAAGRLPASSDR
jgi:glycosyltransferase involved in cell wall biosynthesis